MPEIPFVKNPSGFDGTYPVNLFVEPETAVGRPALVGRPAVTTAKDLNASQSKLIRGFSYEGGSSFWCVNGTIFMEISVTSLNTETTGSGTAMGSANTVPAFLAEGEDHIVAAVGTSLYEAAKSDGVAAVCGPAAVNANTATFQDGYYIVGEADSNRFYVSDVNDPTGVWGASNWGSLAGYSDYLKCIKSWNRTLHGFGDKSIEFWRNAGISGGVPFQRVQGATIREIGLADEYTVAVVDDALYFLDTNFNISRIKGYGYEVVSTPEIRKTFRGYNPLTNRSYGMAMNWFGHSWYVITFPTDNVTWVFDATTNSWFQWSYSATSTSADVPFRCALNIPYGTILGNDGTIAGDEEKLYYLDSAATQDFDSQSIYRERVLPEVSSNRMTAHNLLEIYGKTSGTDTVWACSFSDDGQNSWTATDSVTATGRWAFWQLGSSRRRTYKISTTSNHVDHEYYSAYLDAVPGIS